MNAEALGGLIRHALTTAGGIAVTKGYVDESTMIAGVGAVMTLLGIGWSLYQKIVADTKLQKAIAAPAGRAE